MSIRTKIIVISVVMLSLYSGFDFLLQQAVIRPSYLELEREEAYRDLDRGRKAIRREIEHLHQFCYDWASWDDTYEFASNNMPHYAESNLTPVTFYDNELNLIGILDLEGNPLWSGAYDLETELPIDAADLAGEQWRSRGKLLEPGVEGGISGIIKTSLGPMLISSRAILRSDNSGPSRGVLLMGRFLNETMIEMLQEQTQVSMYLRSPDDPALAEAKAPLPANAPIDPPTGVDDRDSETMHLFSMIYDIFEEPVFALCAEVPREILLRGRAATRVDAFGQLGIGIITLVILLLLLRQTVILPLDRLKGHVTAIGGSGELRPVEIMNRDDEFHALAREFNRMIARLKSDGEKREQAQQALAESERRFQQLLSSLHDVVWSATADHKEMLYINPAVQYIYGRPPEDFIANPLLFQEMVHPDYHENTRLMREELQATGQCDMEYPILRPDGEIRWVHDRQNLIRGDSDEIVRVGGVVRDVTHLKQMHEQMIKAQHLAELGEMGASMAHQIRNPLAGISGALQMIHQGFASDDPRAEATEEALDLVQRVEETVQQLLLYAKPWKPAKRETDLRRFAQLCAETTTARFHLMDCRIQVAPGDPEWVYVDTILLEQVFENLLINAAQAMPDGGAIDIDLERSDRKILLCVRDKGPGFSPDSIHRAFEPFFSTKARGTGLGLSVCRRIMEAHGGAIRLCNAEGGGAEVILEFSLEARS